METPKINTIILAGGMSKRMGQDKGFLNYQNKTFITHITEAFASISNKTIIISNHPAYKDLGFDVHKDLFENTGPLGGLYTGLHYSETPLNFVATCDNPFISIKLYHHLLANSDNYDAILPKHAENIHYLTGVYNKSCIPEFLSALEHGKYAVKNALETLKVKFINCNEFDEKYFLNINTPEDYLKIK